MHEPSSQPRPSLMHEAFSWEVGLTLRVGGTICRVDEILKESDEIVLRHWSSDEKRIAKISDLDSLRGGIDFSIISQPRNGEELAALLARDDAERRYLKKLPLDELSPAQLAQTLIKIRWLLALHRSGYHQFKPSELWEPDIISLAKKNQLDVVSPETLAKWEAEHLSGGGAGLVPHFDLRGGPGRYRCDPIAIEVLLETIRDGKQGLLRNSAGKIVLTIECVASAATHRINVKNYEPDRKKQIQVPSVSTIGRVYHTQVTLYEHDLVNRGRTYADRKHKPTGRRPTIDFPGGVTEFDDLDTKLFCVSARTHLPWGRAWLTHGLDQFSDFLAGRTFSPRARSEVSAIEALVNSIEPKSVPSTIVGRDGLPVKWEAQGYPVQGLFDNALYNNQRIVSLDADVADPGWARPFEPADKRGIEYHNGQVVAYLMTIPGARGPKDDPDAIKEGLATAILTDEQLDHALLHWELVVHANKPMKDGRTPREKYLETGQIPLRPRMPPDVRRLRLLRMVRFKEKHTWNANGIRVMGLTYNDPDLYRMWINRPGGRIKVAVRLDPWDLGTLHVDVPGTDYVLELPCLEKSYVDGLTLYQHQLIRKLCSQSKRRHPSLADFHWGREKLRQMMLEWERSGKVRERRKAARAGKVPDAKTSMEAVHDAEIGCDDLDSVEMEQDDAGWAMPEYA